VRTKLKAFKARRLSTRLFARGEPRFCPGQPVRETRRSVLTYMEAPGLRLFMDIARDFEEPPVRHTDRQPSRKAQGMGMEVNVGLSFLERSCAGRHKHTNKNKNQKPSKTKQIGLPTPSSWRLHRERIQRRQAVTPATGNQAQTGSVVNRGTAYKVPSVHHDWEKLKIDTRRQLLRSRGPERPIAARPMTAQFVLLPS